MQFMHEHATARDFLFRTAQPDFWHRSLHPIDEMRIQRLRQPPPDAGRFIDRSYLFLSRDRSAAFAELF